MSTENEHAAQLAAERAGKLTEYMDTLATVKPPENVTAVNGVLTFAFDDGLIVHAVFGLNRKDEAPPEEGTPNT